MNIKIYDETAVRNLQINQTAFELFEDGNLTPPQYEQVKTAFPAIIIQPNLFIRLGLFLFTYLCISFLIGLISLLLSGSNFSEKGWGILILILGIILTFLNEKFIRERHWYRQGSDNALCYGAITCFVCGLALIGLDGFSTICLLSFVFISLSALRYGDPLLAFGAFYALLHTFIALIMENKLPLMTLPIIGSILSLLVYYFSKTALKNDNLFYWEDCLKVLEITGLVALYGSINYYVVDKILLNNYETRIPTPYNILFAALTAALPLVYLIMGIKNKDRILWILGTLGIVASIMTYRYYFAIMPIEWALSLAGLIVLVLAVYMIKYFKTPQHGFVYLAKNNKNNFIESLVMNQVLQKAAHTNQADGDIKYGGGDFDGGGAGSEY